MTMTTCPACNHDNIQGVDVCDECGQTLTDLSEPTVATALEESLLEDPISSLLPKKPVLVAPSMPVGEVLKLQVANRTGVAIIVENDLPIGIFSERDALMRLNTDIAAKRDQPVSDFMTKDPRTLKIDDKVAFAVHRMHQGGYRHLPIVNADGQVTGVVSAREVLRYITDHLAGV
jgi:CBS domain-containing protein